MTGVLFGSLVFFFLLNVPIAVAIGLASLSAILMISILALVLVYVRRSGTEELL